MYLPAAAKRDVAPLERRSRKFKGFGFQDKEIANISAIAAGSVFSFLFPARAPRRLAAGRALSFCLLPAGADPPRAAACVTSSCARRPFFAGNWKIYCPPRGLCLSPAPARRRGKQFISMVIPRLFPRGYGLASDFGDASRLAGGGGLFIYGAHLDRLPARGSAS